jgi:hypothetical protein
MPACKNVKKLDSLPGEIWENIPVLDNYYQISNMGRVKSKFNFIRKSSLDKDGYLRISFIDKNNNKKILNYFIHRLIAIAFIPNLKNLPKVNHKDGNKLNNSIENLEWVSGHENLEHARKIGLTNNVCDKNGNAKLTWADIKYIRSQNPKIKFLNKDKPKGFTQKLAEKFNVSAPHLHAIWNERQWKRNRK